MSIATKTGDRGETGLMYNRRVSKCHPRVEAYGCVDELNAALGLVRATSPDDKLDSTIKAIQTDLVVLMGELATDVADLPRYRSDGFKIMEPALTARLDDLVAQLEAQPISFRGWAIPGDSLPAAALDHARTTCRRAERRVCALQQSELLANPEIVVYLNRLADVLWLLARHVEAQAG